MVIVPAATGVTEWTAGSAAAQSGCTNEKQGDAGGLGHGILIDPEARAGPFIDAEARAGPFTNAEARVGFKPFIVA